MKDSPSWWDSYSNQPYKLQAKDKPRISLSNVSEYFKAIANAVVRSPNIAWHFYRSCAKPSDSLAADFVGLSISPDLRYQDEIVRMVEELGVNNLLFRIPTWRLESMDEYLNFIRLFSDKDILINVLQCRESVMDESKWEQALVEIFERFSSITSSFQIGNAINRTKWGCAHSGEYLDLLEIAERVRSRFPDVRLVGSSVIDFEPLVALRTLWNKRRYHLDLASALLYVNRRGSPFGRQYRYFDLHNKLRLLNAIVQCSNKNPRGLWITEMNWPLLDTKPYTPNSGHPSRTVDEKTQAKYLTQYFQIAYQCGWVDRVYWWELINPGYGLVDSRAGGLRKMPSYYAFRELLAGSLYESASQV